MTIQIQGFEFEVTTRFNKNTNQTYISIPKLGLETYCTGDAIAEINKSLAEAMECWDMAAKDCGKGVEEEINMVVYDTDED